MALKNVHIFNGERDLDSLFSDYLNPGGAGMGSPRSRTGGFIGKAAIINIGNLASTMRFVSQTGDLE